jgi:hypothetical protein
MFTFNPELMTGDDNDEDGELFTYDNYNNNGDEDENGDKDENEVQLFLQNTFIPHTINLTFLKIVVQGG